jgi:hypothetical protein
MAFLPPNDLCFERSDAGAAADRIVIATLAALVLEHVGGNQHHVSTGLRLGRHILSGPLVGEVVGEGEQKLSPLLPRLLYGDEEVH